jgi:hypothetical protein
MEMEFGCGSQAIPGFLSETKVCEQLTTLQKRVAELEGENKDLREALKPFADVADLLDEHPSLLSLPDDEKVQLELKHLRRAAALANKGE